MNYLVYGEENDKTVLLLHGLCTSAEICYGPIVSPLVEAGYRVVLAEIDGHSPRTPEDLASLSACCDDVERFVKARLRGSLWCLGGFSMGATMAVEIAGRGNLPINRVFLDAPLTMRLGVLSPVFTLLFTRGTAWLQEGKPVPQFLLDFAMGKGNNSVVEMLYPEVSQTTIRHACDYLYHYDLPAGLYGFRGAVQSGPWQP